MPRVNIPVTTVAPLNGALGGWSVPAVVAFDAANDHEMVNDGRTFLLLQNTANATASVTVDSVADEYGRIGDIAIVVPAYVSSTQNSLVVCGPFKMPHYSQQGKLLVDSTAAPATLFLSGIRGADSN